MIEEFESIISALINPRKEKHTFSIFDATDQFNEVRKDSAGLAQAINAAFLIHLAGAMHPESERAKCLLTRMLDLPEWADIAAFYMGGINLLHREIQSLCRHDHNFAYRLKSLSEWLSNKENVTNKEERAEKIWAVFFPEATGIQKNKQERVKRLRAKRIVSITKLNTNPITDPAGQILFTSNVLLTICPPSKSLDKLLLRDHLKEKLLDITREPQLHYYDHPIQAGVEPGNNEVLYGLRGLDAAFEYERERGNMSPDVRATCVLSVSVTHRGLQDIAKTWLQEEFLRSVSLKNIDVYMFTEADTQLMIDEILAPAALRYLQREDAKELLNIFGVDGEYGRHYSFLKAIAPFWKIFIQPEIRATFKIDLDQIFPQKELVEQTGSSTFEHLKTPLWGAWGLDSNRQPLELAMIAGALVNKPDISRSLFTPDVPFPSLHLSPDQYIFFSTLPQALSTEAEMMTRYTMENLDGQGTCLQRVHVTGGTNGILVDALLRHRPFTPSFIGRAEDQAYILSVFPKPGTKLAYVHKDGLIMRHDKEDFAHDAIQSAYVSKLLGDYIRIIYFSAYAKVLTADAAKLKESIDPFTGCFISKIPTTVVYLRFSLKAASFFASGKEEEGLEFIKSGAKRIMKALDFLCGENSMLKRQYEKERLGWNLYYDTLLALEDALKGGDTFARQLCKKVKSIVNQCAISLPNA